MIDYDRIIRELGETLGAELKFNDEDMCELAIGGSTILSIERRPDAGTLLMTSVVADALPDPVDYALVLDLLDFSLGAALNGTPAIGRDEVSGLVVAHQTVTAQNLKDASFAAMRSFVLKNLTYDARDISTATIDLLAAKLTEYVEICAINDGDERNRKLGDFFAKAKWLTPDEQEKFDELVRQRGKGTAEEVVERKTLDERKLFTLFRNVIGVAFFRETSKIGLDFFRSKGTPVMFQFSDYSGKSYVGRENELFQPEGWRDGENAPGFRENGGSFITNSEMRHALRMGENTNVHFVGGGTV